MTYKIENESFVEALDQLIRQFRKENVGIGTFAYKTSGPDGSYSIRVTEPRAQKGRKG